MRTVDCVRARRRQLSRRDVRDLAFRAHCAHAHNARRIGSLKRICGSADRRTPRRIRRGCHRSGAQRHIVRVVGYGIRAEGHRSCTGGRRHITERNRTLARGNISVAERNRALSGGGIVRPQRHRSRAGRDVRIADRHRAIAVRGIAHADGHRLPTRGQCALADRDRTGASGLRLAADRNGVACQRLRTLRTVATERDGARTACDYASGGGCSARAERRGIRIASGGILPDCGRAGTAGGRLAAHGDRIASRRLRAFGRVSAYRDRIAAACQCGVARGAAAAVSECDRSIACRLRANAHCNAARASGSVVETDRGSARS
ncbi:hypothetical protein Y599_967 [Burkholderia pseudomallei MSHR3458]|nr:hypothetical protein Y044_32 [Burkholderia pseudomallei MSHR2243]AIV72153.1 hypothetical protein Y028_2652 [Burkholderia pseudomallei MSHR62]KGW68576.1 hypothetical protein Y599_967 [Burkholderia pseudomallei MSHR3458]